jgi:hypothetical protein
LARPAANISPTLAGKNYRRISSLQRASAACSSMTGLARCAELQTRADNNVVRRFTSTSADRKGPVKESLRDRPDRIIIGKTRGPEALDLPDAAVTGHPGLSTIHADNCDEALTRIQRLANCAARLGPRSHRSGGAYSAIFRREEGGSLRFGNHQTIVRERPSKRPAAKGSMRVKQFAAITSQMINHKTKLFWLGK